MIASQSAKTALCLCLLFVLVHCEKDVKGISHIKCAKSKCKGPLRLYEEMKCKPVYENPDDCCAIRYDCSHLSTRDPENHCYANGREYDVLEKLRDEDNDNPCETECRCNGTATFSCRNNYHALPELPKKDCFHRYIQGTCNSAEIICPLKGEERAKCVVDGKTYLDGESFFPSDRPDLACLCRPGFKGEFVEPFCWNAPCKWEKQNYRNIHYGCAPIYFLNALPQNNCPYKYKCRDNDDEIIPQPRDESPDQVAPEKVPDEMKCKYGTQLLNIGDKLKKRGFDYYTCVSCMCEVPPLMTCRQHPWDFTKSECTAIDHL